MAHKNPEIGLDLLVYSLHLSHCTCSDRWGQDPGCTYKEVVEVCVPMMVDGNIGGEGGKSDIPQGVLPPL